MTIKHTQWITLWLLGCAGLVSAMVMVGAITRLTESGLSMVEWRPLIGFLPPLSESEWRRVLDLYRTTPEFIKENFWMQMHDFKAIFFWEWLHRLLGRIIGMAYGLPLIFFWIRGWIPKGYGKIFLGLLCLGAAQGYMGWFMVQSGLVDRPSVSHYRLAAHLSLAFLIFALLLRTALSLNPQWIKPIKSTGTLNYLLALIGFYILTVFWGAYTAGLDAGLIYNDTFPKMGGRWIPHEINLYTPLFVNFFENPVIVQFAHRWLALITCALAIGLWVHGFKNRTLSRPLHALTLAFILQPCLGLATLFSHVHIVPAALHQSGALLILALLVINLQKYKTTT